MSVCSRLEVRRLLVQPKICPPCPYSLKPAAITPPPKKKTKKNTARLVRAKECRGSMVREMWRLRSLRARRATHLGPLPDGGPRTGSANPQSLKNLPKNWSLRGRLTARPGLAVGRALDHAARRARSTTLEKSQHTGGMGHISAFTLANLKS